MSKGKSKTREQTTLPDWQMDLFKDFYERSKQAADRPFEGYTDQRYAPLSPQELQAQAAIQGLFGSSFGYDPTAQLQQLAGQAAPTISDVPSLLDVDIGAYQSPYQQQVIDLALEVLSKNTRQLSHERLWSDMFSAKFLLADKLSFSYLRLSL